MCNEFQQGLDILMFSNDNTLVDKRQDHRMHMLRLEEKQLALLDIAEAVERLTQHATLRASFFDWFATHRHIKRRISSGSAYGLLI